MNEIATYETIPASVMVHTPPKGATALDLRRAVAREKDLIQSLPMVERSVFLAASAKVAQEYDNAELSAELGETIPRIARDVGIRTTSGKDWENNMVRIVQIMRKYYPMFSVRDVQMAFELSVTGELNDYLPKDRYGNPDKEHYQMFNADYFCKIMNAYRDFRKGVLNKVADMVPAPEQGMSDADKLYYTNIGKRNTINAFIFYKYHGYMPKISPIMEAVIYEELAKVGLAEPIAVTVQEQRLILRRTLFDLGQRHLIGDKNRVAAQGINAPEIQHPAFMLARYRALKTAFAEMVADDVQIMDYIKYEKRK